MTIAVLISWVAGILLGIAINSIIMKYISYGTRVQYALIVLAFVAVSAAIGMPVAYLITYNGMKLINEINSKIERIAECDFTARLDPITKNPQINTVVHNFNEMVKQLNSVAVLKNDFISGFSHEFRTPIVSVKGYAELLSDAENLTPEQLEYVRVIIEESERLSRLSESTMMLAKLDSQSIICEKKTFSLDGQIEDCILLLDGALKEKNIEVETNLDRAIVKSDPYLIKEVWINVLNNAVKFCRDNGKIAVTLKNCTEKCVVSIKDDGIGMDEETKKHIFDKFFQYDNSHASKGMGLGLSIVSRILELTGGSIVCESEIGKGTEMIISLLKE